MIILLSAYSINPYNGSEDGVGWNWLLQYEKNKKENDEIYVLTKKYNEKATLQGLRDCGIDDVKLCIVDVPDALNWFREKYSIFHHMYYILWQYFAYKWVKKSNVKFDIIHHVTMGDYRIPGKMHKFKRSYTIFGPVGGAQITPKGLKKYEKNKLTSKIRELVNKSCKYNPFYIKAICGFDAVYPSNIETYEVIQKIRKNGKTKKMVEIALSEEYKKLKVIHNSNDVCRVLFVGRLIEKKGILFLIDVLKKLEDTRDIVFELYGEGPLANEIKQYMSNSKWGSRLQFYGQIKHSEMKKIYEKADVFVLLSLRETGGTVLIEAMAHALPIVGFNTSFCHQLKENSCGIFVDTKQNTEAIIDEFAAAVKLLALNKEMRNSLGQKAYDYVNNSLTWEQKYNEVIKDAIKT